MKQIISSTLYFYWPDTELCLTLQSHLRSDHPVTITKVSGCWLPAMQLYMRNISFLSCSNTSQGKKITHPLQLDVLDCVAFRCCICLKLCYKSAGPLADSSEFLAQVCKEFFDVKTNLLIMILAGVSL